MSRGLGNGISMSKGATPPLAPNCLTARGVSRMLFVYILTGFFFIRSSTLTLLRFRRGLVYPTLFLHGGTCYYDLKERVGSIFFIRSSTLTLPRFRHGLTYPTLFLHGGTCYYELKERVGSIFFYKKLHFNAATL